MSQSEIESLLSALELYSSFFITLIAFGFVSFVFVLAMLIKNIKSRKSLKENREILSETIAAQEEERGRISQELHDTVSQNIKALVLMQEQLESSCSDEAQKTRLKEIIALEKQNQKELRAIIQNLQSPALKGVPFKTLVADLCERFQTQSGIPCSLFVAPDVPLDGFSREERHHILRIIQEALNNAKAHANASETSVVIRTTHDEPNLQNAGSEKIVFMIFDDGAGLSHGKTASSEPLHFGMSGMEMRATLLGGTLTINSNAETGTEVRLEIEKEAEDKKSLI